jgi:hypothetical protein
VLPGDDAVIARIRRSTARALEPEDTRGLIDRVRDAPRSRIWLVGVACLFAMATIVQWALILGASLPFGRSAPPASVETPAEHHREVRAQLSTTPDELFTRANIAQRDGAAAEAASLYGELERSFPGTSEELVSRVLLGRLLLDRLDDAKGALAQFDSYLASPELEALREEALIGRALALERLARHSEEKRAWELLLAAYPRSSYAEPARTRLDELGSSF